MPVHIIPVNKLTPTALRGVIEEFISRSVAAYAENESSREADFRQVKNKLKMGSAVLVFDDETATTNVFLADDPVLKKMSQR